jgi:aminoglycoside phosphotransferase (APT) family kinase protein
MSKKQSDYEKYLATMHARLVTPDEVIRNVIREGTGNEFNAKEKIIAGEANEVYDITLSDDTHVILRISRSGHPNFLQEKWALEQVKKVGVPVPEILLIKYVTVGEEELSLCLMKKVDGEPLERGKIDFNVLPENERKAYIVKAGEILSKIHSIKTKGYGWIIGEGKSEYDTSDNIIDDILGRKKRLYEITKNESITHQQIDEALKMVEQFRKSYSETVPHLNHGDYGHKHLMVKDGKIVAILDWGGVRSDTPIYEFACWDYWFGEYIPTKWLKEGYQNKELFNGDFDVVLHTLRIMKGIEIIDWYDSQKYKQAVDKAIGKLLKDLAYFK